jgi:hypothetical protein
MSYCPPTPQPTIPVIEKVSTAVLPYGFNLAPIDYGRGGLWGAPGPQYLPWLFPGEEVISLVVTSDGGTPSGTGNVNIEAQTITQNMENIQGALLTAWIGGGTVGTNYIITFAWTTNSLPIPRQDSRSLQLNVIQTL